jgi:hypothetical protein
MNRTDFLQLVVEKMNCFSQQNYFELLKQTIHLISSKSEQIFYRISDGFHPSDNSRCEACRASTSWGGYSSD